VLEKNKKTVKPESNTTHHHLAQGSSTHTLADKSSSSLINKKSFKFRWWYAAIFILVIAVVGIAILRFSRASAGKVQIEKSNFCEAFKNDIVVGWIVRDAEYCKDTFEFYDTKNITTVYHPWNGRQNVLLRKSDNTCYGFDRERTQNVMTPYVNTFAVTIQEYLQIDRANCNPQPPASTPPPSNPVDEVKAGTSPLPRKYDSTTEQNILTAMQVGISDVALRALCGEYDQSGKCRNFVDANYPRGLVFDNLHQQLVQIALHNGATVDALNYFCGSFTDAAGCKAYVSQQAAYIKGDGSPPPPPVVTPPPCLASTGCNNGVNGWQKLAENPAFYYNTGFEGGTTCVAPLTSTQFDLNNKYVCESLKIQARCKPYYDAIAHGDTSKVATTPDECGGADLRAALNAANLYQRNLTPPIGNVEGINGDCTTLYGWTASDAALDRPLGVDIYNGPGEQGQKIANNLPANIYRQDLYNAFNHKYGGAHGFQFAIPNSLKDNQDHTIYVYSLAQYINGLPNPNNNKLIGTKTIKCDYPPQGNLEKIEAQMQPSNQNGTFTCTVTGWTNDQSAPNESIKIDAYVDGEGVAHDVVANQFRDDLLKAGFGTGNHQYVFDIPPKFRDGNKHTLQVYGLGVNIYNQRNGINNLVGVKDFQCDQPPTGNAENVITSNVANNLVCAIKGWAADPSYFFANSIVAYYDPSPDFKTYAYLDKPYSANLAREDLATYPQFYGNTKHGFVYPVPSQFFDGNTHKVYLYALNVDRNGVYIKQNNTFIGSQTIKCPKKPTTATNVNNTTAPISQPSNQVVSSTITTGVDTNDNNKKVQVVVTRTPLAYDQVTAAKQVGSVAKQQAFKNASYIPGFIPSTTKLAQTQADGDNGPVLKEKVYIKPDLPIDIGIEKVVIYIDGQSPVIYNSLNDATRTLDTKTLADGVHTIQVLAFNGASQNVRALEQRIQTSNGGLNALQRFYYALGSRN